MTSQPNWTVYNWNVNKQAGKSSSDGICWWGKKNVCRVLQLCWSSLTLPLQPDSRLHSNICYNIKHIKSAEQKVAKTLWEAEHCFSPRQQSAPWLAESSCPSPRCLSAARGDSRSASPSASPLHWLSRATTSEACTWTAAAAWRRWNLSLLPAVHWASSREGGAFCQSQTKLTVMACFPVAPFLPFQALLHLCVSWTCWPASTSMKLQSTRWISPLLFGVGHVDMIQS